MPSRRFLPAILVLALASFACSVNITDTPAPQPATETAPNAVLPTPVPPTLPPAAAALTLEQLKNAEVQITGVSDTNKTRTIKLTDGKFQSASDISAPDYVSVGMSDQVAFGDLNGDGAPDAAIIIGENYGGSGDFVSVVAMLNQNGQPVFASAAGIGDRPKVNSLAIQDGEIIADTVIQGPNDPACCPTQPSKRSYRLWSNKLVLTRIVSKIPDGTERIIKIDAPAPGSEVSGPFTVSGSVTIAPFENTLAYSVFLEGTPDPVEQSSFIVSAADMGGPGTFELPLDFTTAGIHGNIRIEISDLSAADGSELALATLFVTVK